MRVIVLGIAPISIFLAEEIYDSAPEYVFKQSNDSEDDDEKFHSIMKCTFEANFKNNMDDKKKRVPLLIKEFELLFQLRSTFFKLFDEKARNIHSTTLKISVNQKNEYELLKNLNEKEFQWTIIEDILGVTKVELVLNETLENLFHFEILTHPEVLKCMRCRKYHPSCTSRKENDETFDFGEFKGCCSNCVKIMSYQYK